jgi:hypothetical protein
MATLYPAKLTLSLLTVALVALLATACSGGEKEEAVDSNPGSGVATGLSATVYASPT